MAKTLKENAPLTVAPFVPKRRLQKSPVFRITTNILSAHKSRRPNTNGATVCSAAPTPT